MHSRFKTFLVYFGAAGTVGLLLFAFIVLYPTPDTVPLSEEKAGQTANVAYAGPTTTSAGYGSVRTEESSPANAPEEEGSTTRRIPDPYPFPPESYATITGRTRAALVNIFCTPESDTLRPISGSGVIIDPRGIILTNAHVAQYILLSESPEVNMTCVIRSGSPAAPLWNAEVLYIPRVWVHEHASDITKTHSVGTGEHDYALLRITEQIATDPSNPSSSALPALPIDTRHGIGFLGDSVLSASYPAEFISEVAESGLYPIASMTTIQELLTFGEGTVDLIALRGTLEAQGGSSGGPVVNDWSHLIGIITTTSEGSTPMERILHALTLSYIDHDLETQTGFGLAHFLAGDTEARAREFNSEEGPALNKLLIEALSENHR